MAGKFPSRTGYAVVGGLWWPTIKSQCLDGNAKASRDEDFWCHGEVEQEQPKLGVFL